MPNISQIIENDLRKNVYHAMRLIVQGFTQWSDNHININNTTELNQVYICSRVLLFRLISLFYAESRNLLKSSNPNDQIPNGFKKILSFIRQHVDQGTQPDSRSVDLWLILKSIFSRINHGIFSPSFNDNLEKWNIANEYLVDVIILLSKTKDEKKNLQSIDYSTIKVHNIGRIYEMLLKFQLKIAEEPKILIRNNIGEMQWISYTKYLKLHIHSKDFSSFNENERISQGQLYLALNTDEREVSGSFYSRPDVVRKIISQSLIPIISAKSSHALNNQISTKDAILSIKILDPAMGCGEFLIETMDYLGSQLFNTMNEDSTIQNPQKKLYSLTWAKNEVLTHCLYGVDKDPMAVELTKLSLWLTIQNPDLSFDYLDQHLRIGNSLVGIDNNTLITLFKHIFGDLNKDTEIWYRKENSKKLSKLFILANAIISQHFVSEQIKIEIEMWINSLMNLPNSSVELFEQNNIYQKVLELVRNEHIFHWSLEFPEIFSPQSFFEGSFESGFDVIIGNPPWGIKFSEYEKKYLKTRFKNVNDYESFQYFMIQSINLAKKGGYISFIIPNTMPLNVLATDFRNTILEKGCLLYIEDYSDIPLFDDPGVRCITFLFRKEILPSQLCMFVRYDESGNKIIERNIANYLLRNAPNWTKFLKCDEAIFGIIEKIEIKHIKLGEILDSKQGYIPYRYSTLKKRYGDVAAGKIIQNRAWHSSIQIEKDYWKELQGGDIGRYSLQWSGTWVKYGSHVSTYVDPIYFSKPRLLFREITNNIPYCLNVTYSDETYINNPSIIGAIKKANSDPYSMYYLLAMCNSALISTYFFNTFPKAKKGLFPKILVDDVRLIPIYPIKFTTDKSIRMNKLNEFKGLFQIESSNDLLIRTAPFRRDILLNKQFDIMHDILDFLSNQMILYSNQIDHERLRFLAMLESFLQTKIHLLHHKRKLNHYDFLSFDSFLEKIKSNNLIITSERDFQTQLQKKFETSTNKLTLLKERQRNIDELIDEIIFELFELTKDQKTIINKMKKPF